MPARSIAAPRAIRVFHHDTQSGGANLIVGFSQNPYARAIHRHDRIHALRRPQFQRVHITRRSHPVPVERGHFELVPWQRNPMLLRGARIENPQHHPLAFLRPNRLLAPSALLLIE